MMTKKKSKAEIEKIRQLFFIVGAISMYFFIKAFNFYLLEALKEQNTLESLYYVFMPLILSYFTLVLLNKFVNKRRKNDT